MELGNVTNVPQEMRNKKQWSVSYSAQELKRPLHYQYTPDGGLAADKAVKVARKNGVLSGFYVTESDNLVLVDIDHVTDTEALTGIPEELVNFIKNTPTYWEVSPSGNGLRGIVKIDKAEDKKKLKQKIALLIGQNGDTNREAQINFGAPWMTITCNPTSYSTDTIAPVTLDELGLYFDVRYKGSSQEHPLVPTEELPDIEDMSRILSGLPLDQNPRIKRAYKKVFGHEYQHYEYWMKVMMAMHSFAQLADKTIACLDLMNDWSAQDASTYKGYDDVANHWKSLENAEGSITYRTLFALNKEMILVWPIPKPQSKIERELGMAQRPLNSAYANFEALCLYYDIRFFRDEFSTSNMYSSYMSCDYDIADKFDAERTHMEFDLYYGPYTKDTLVPVFSKFLQDNGFLGITFQRVKEFLQTMLSRKLTRINLFKMYLDTPFNDLPEKYKDNARTYEYSTIDNLFKCLSIEPIFEDIDEREQELALYKRQFTIWLLGMIRNLYYSRDQYNINNCILVLVGKEQTRKTSFFKAMLPERYREKHVKFTTHGFDKAESMRDLAKIASTSMILIWDEVERYINAQNESNFKKVIDNTPQTIIDKYEVAEKTVTPIAVYAATSNQREFKLGDTGSRRMFIIPIKWAHTNKVNMICWHALLNEVRVMYEHAVRNHQTPWLLTESELNFQLKLHGSFKSKTDIDIILGEMFEGEPLDLEGKTTIPGISSVQADTTGRLLTSTRVREMFVRYSGVTNVKPSAFEKAIQRFCSAYTGTERTTIYTLRPKAQLTKGVLQQGVHKRWVFPPLSEAAKKKMEGFIPIN